MIALIPARGGSKGVPGKNIRYLDGMPLLAHTIGVAHKSAKIDRIILSTDSKEIAEIGIECGAEVPFMRPSELAQDDSLDIDNSIYTIERLNKEFDGYYDRFVTLQPTSPLRTSEDIDNAINIFVEHNADAVVSVCEVPYCPEWLQKIDKNGNLTEWLDTEIALENRQKLETAYVPNGAVYVLKLATLKAKRTYYTDKTYPYVMPPERSIDIDTYFDFELAEFIMGRK